MSFNLFSKVSQFCSPAPSFIFNDRLAIVTDNCGLWFTSVQLCHYHCAGAELQSQVTVEQLKLDGLGFSVAAQQNFSDVKYIC